MPRSRPTLRSWPAALLVLLLAACGGGGSSSSPPPPPVQETPIPGDQSVAGLADTAYTDATVYSSAPAASIAHADEGKAVAHRQITVQGASLQYTATTGHLAILDGNGQAKASFFYVAYTLDGADPATRPVTFFYNGGPGSATIWLHLGSFGPRRLVTGDPATTAATPFPLVVNDETLLPSSDLVFVDAIGTGYSEAVAPHNNQEFWGVDVDAAAFRDFVQRWVSVNARSASPKFLFGESYGTTRSAVLAELLEAAGVHLKGVVLQSSVLDYNVNCGVIGQGDCATYLPSYAATGAYFQRTTPVPQDLWSFLDQVRSFTLNGYEPALQAYLQQNTAPSASLLSQLSADTGISTAVWQQHFNLDPDTFREQLIPGSLLGRYDARVSAPVGSALASEGDPSSTFMDAQFALAIHTYLDRSLQYHNASTYVPLGNAIETWNFSHDNRSLPDVVPDLATALTLNPQLKVFSANGVHDLATPFFQTEQDLARLGSTAPVQLTFYEGGHMTYLDDRSRPKELADLKAFYQQAVGGAR